MLDLISHFPRLPVSDHAHDLLVALPGLSLHVDFIALCTLLQFVVLLLILNGSLWVLHTVSGGVFLFEVPGDNLIQVTGSQRVAVLLQGVHSLRH
jgi:hypothetical protein